MEPIAGAAAAAISRRALIRSPASRARVRRSNHTLGGSEDVIDRTNSSMGRSEILLMWIDTGDARWEPARGE
jgi:hypothetical protein